MKNCIYCQGHGLCAWCFHENQERYVAWRAGRFEYERKDWALWRGGIVYYKRLLCWLLVEMAADGLSVRVYHVADEDSVTKTQLDRLTELASDTFIDLLAA
jgi:hypothetical protein